MPIFQVRELRPGDSKRFDQSRIQDSTPAHALPTALDCRVCPLAPAL